MEIWLIFCFLYYGDHQDLHVLTHSFPTRRCSDLDHVVAPRSERATEVLLTQPLAVHVGGVDEGDTGVERGVDDAFAGALVKPCPEVVASERSEEHTSELQSLMRISYAVFCLKKNKTHTNQTHIYTIPYTLQ